MKRNTYVRLMEWERSNPKRVCLIVTMNKIITGALYCVYPILLLILYKIGNKHFWKVLLVPSISLILISIFRCLYREERPYTKFRYDSIVSKDESGKSMPSRHVFSAFMIGMTFYYIRPLYSVPIFLCAVMMSVVRVLLGVHYPKDAVVGAVAAIVLGMVGFYVIPF